MHALLHGSVWLRCALKAVHFEETCFRKCCIQRSNSWEARGVFAVLGHSLASGAGALGASPHPGLGCSSSPRTRYECKIFCFGHVFVLAVTKSFVGASGAAPSRLHGSLRPHLRVGLGVSKSLFEYFAKSMPCGPGGFIAIIGALFLLPQRLEHKASTHPPCVPCFVSPACRNPPSFPGGCLAGRNKLLPVS